MKPHSHKHCKPPTYASRLLPAAGQLVHAHGVPLSIKFLNRIKITNPHGPGARQSNYRNAVVSCRLELLVRLSRLSVLYVLSLCHLESIFVLPVTFLLTVIDCFFSDHCTCHTMHCVWVELDMYQIIVYSHFYDIE